MNIRSCFKSRQWYRTAGVLSIALFAIACLASAEEDPGQFLERNVPDQLDAAFYRVQRITKKKYSFGQINFKKDDKEQTAAALIVNDKLVGVRDRELGKITLLSPKKREFLLADLKSLQVDLSVTAAVGFPLGKVVGITVWSSNSGDQPIDRSDPAAEGLYLLGGIPSRPGKGTLSFVTPGGEKKSAECLVVKGQVVAFSFDGVVYDRKRGSGGAFLNSFTKFIE